eukprot:CAMPEP_0178973692 /NCGR_PEP_ID=MMETSP0789-20121207/21894_1 /TAXON_ID=3005 /ORGANISM="Rhizosolenia setigera, Strain CCMP 1694" /LENGTH=452 /DNA_ID=CAMNT_0020661647 /DNA_START=530 /DNA_END=1888 /DNA_ORIENTATION=-
MKVYLVSAVGDHTKTLKMLWSSIPTDVITLEGDDFFTEDQGRYKTMGVDRVAALKGATSLTGFPALVVDGGTATTYTATDSSGKILGGGIGPGLYVKLRSLYEYTDKLPRLHPAQVTDVLDKAIKEGEKIPIFSRDTNEAIITNILSEYQKNMMGIVQHWLKTVGKYDENAPDNNKTRRIYFTGGDGDIMLRTLNHSIFDSDPDHPPAETTDGEGPTSTGFIKEVGCETEYRKHLIHEGIAALLVDKVNERILQVQKQLKKIEVNSENFNAKIVGQRVAKNFNKPNKTRNQDHYFRGVVKEYDSDKEDGNYYKIEYNDGDEEDVTLEELKELIVNFLTFGEGPKTLSSDSVSKNSASGRGRKRKQNSTPTGAKKKPTNSLLKEPELQVEKRIAKYFEGSLYFGTVVKFLTKAQLWHIVYDDGDQEEFDEKDMKKALDLYESEKASDPKQKGK